MSFTEKANRILRFFSGHRRPKTAAVILAAGLGTRMKSVEGSTKQLLTLEGKPLFMHSVLAFDSSAYVDELVLVVRKDEYREVRRALKSYKLKKPLRLTVGGDTRQASAKRGLDAISDKMEYIAVHDAARCLITPPMIADVVTAAYANRAASAGTPVTDTVKQVSKDGYVEKTVDRSTLYRAQTPQVFECKLYRAATYVAIEKKQTVTDDNMLVELLGQTVKMVDCGSENIKVTTKEDLALARIILRAREEKMN
ncbi:MAG: 2-C-methyl-D-erythritol 4-phosphate cytidylyltransferase [Ruminococcaceae bacterium]|nr:2-C-methyl-D-erythritol 4-phosphate cytidylyltransferase [Oscillospiraceae bacterium]